MLERRTFLTLPGNPQKSELKDVFSWLAPTRTSEAKTGRDTTPDDVHPAQMFWGMPRRIRLDFQNVRAGRCDLCGAETDTLISQFITKNYGIDYNGPWLHPLTPHSFDKQGAPLPRHPQPGGVSYRHWLGLVQAGESRQPARVVDAFNQRNTELRAQFILWAFGYDMDNMKARCWYESMMPLYQLTGATLEDFEVTAKACVEAAETVRGYLVSALKQAWFERPGDAKGDLSFIDLSLWQNTETEFYNMLHDLAEALNGGQDGFIAMNQAKERWHKVLCQQALFLFDQWAASGAFEYENPRRIATAYNQLRRSLYGKKLRTTVLALPEKRKAEVSDNVAV